MRTCFAPYTTEPQPNLKLDCYVGVVFNFIQCKDSGAHLISSRHICPNPPPTPIPTHTHTNAHISCIIPVNVEYGWSQGHHSSLLHFKPSHCHSTCSETIALLQQLNSSNHFAPWDGATSSLSCPIENKTAFCLASRTHSPRTQPAHTQPVPVIKGSVGNVFIVALNEQI